MSAGDDPFAVFQIKGLNVQRRSIGQRVNEIGQTENHYEIVNDPEWAEGSQSKYEAEYMDWHQRYHVRQGVRDDRCRICIAEAAFQLQQLPHLQNHKRLGKYEPSCRFCQDERFFGRM